jgi:hypothetical protein
MIGVSSAESSSSSATVCAGAGRVWATEDPVHRFVRWSRLGVFVRICTHRKAHRTAASLRKKGLFPAVWPREGKAEIEAARVASAWFLVELGAAMMVASTIVRAVTVNARAGDAPGTADRRQPIGFAGYQRSNLAMA